MPDPDFCTPSSRERGSGENSQSSVLTGNFVTEEKAVIEIPHGLPLRQVA